MATNDRTLNRSYAKPSVDNKLDEDLPRMREALDAIDSDVNTALVNAAGAVSAVSGATATATQAGQLASQANGAAGAARLVVAVTADDDTPGGLASKIEATGALTEAVGNAGGDEKLRLGVRDASASQTGVVRLATPQQASAGADDGLAVTPAGVKAALGDAVLSSKIPRSARAGNTKLVAADRGSLVDVLSGSFAQTFDPAASLGAGWWLFLRNSGTGDVTLTPSAGQTIDGLSSFISYPGEVRLIQSNGSTLTSVVIGAFTKLFGSTASFVRAPGYAAFDVAGLGGAGGGAGGGTRRPAVDDIHAGGGGGGGAYFERRISAAALAATEVVTVGTGGAGGAGAAANSNLTAGSLGAAGLASSFGTHLRARGGFGGQPGGRDAPANGGAGADALLGATENFWKGAPSVPPGGFPPVPWWGGAGGGKSGDHFGAPTQGGRSVHGGCGGGGGGGADPTAGSWGGGAPPYAGQEGGTPYDASEALYGGGATGGAANAALGGNAGNGSSGTTQGNALRGTGGGGGGGGGGQGGDGGAGGRAAGGGGGGTGFNGRGGNGGTGGAGCIRVIGVA